jgi:hypothetical protein
MGEQRRPDGMLGGFTVPVAINRWLWGDHRRAGGLLMRTAGSCPPIWVREAVTGLSRDWIEEGY